MTATATTDSTISASPTASSSSSSSSPRRRRSSSIALAAAAAVGLAICAGVADAFVSAPPAVRARAASASIPATPTTATTPVAPLAAVGVEPAPRDADKPGLKFGCEDSWDCEGTQSCCDFIFFKVCCNDGTAAQGQWVPVPVPVRPNDGYPGPYGGGSNGGGYYR